MHMLRRQVFLAASAVMLMAVTAAPEVRAGLGPLYTTGAGGTPGSADLHYTLLSAPGGVPTTAFDVSPSANAAYWVATSLHDPLWISPVKTAADSSLSSGFISNGKYTPYDYQTLFTSSAAGNYTFTVTFAADDAVSIVLNGTTERAAKLGSEYDYTALTTVSFTSNVVAGNNALDFLVYNTGKPPVYGPTQSATGLLVTDLTAVAVAAPEPSTVWIAIFGGISGLVVLRRRSRSTA